VFSLKNKRRLGFSTAIHSAERVEGSADDGDDAGCTRCVEFATEKLQLFNVAKGYQRLATLLPLAKSRVPQVFIVRCDRNSDSRVQASANRIVMPPRRSRHPALWTPDPAGSHRG